MSRTLAVVACADGGGIPTSPSATNTSATSPSASADAQALVASSPRSGDFHVTKACPTYTGLAGDHCTVTASDLKAIELGTRFVYLEAVDDNGVLDSDIELDPPGPGHNKAFGHCKLVGEIGLCTFSGGTGKFTHFHGSAAVSCPAAEFPNCTVEGTYNFSPGN